MSNNDIKYLQFFRKWDNYVKENIKEVLLLIHLENISKTFKVAKRSSSTGAAIKSFFKREYEEVHALNNVSFDIKEGEIVGYIRAEWSR